MTPAVLVCVAAGRRGVSSARGPVAPRAGPLLAAKPPLAASSEDEAPGVPAAPGGRAGGGTTFVIVDYFIFSQFN